MAIALHGSAKVPTFLTIRAATDVPRLVRTANFAVHLYLRLNQKTPGTGPWLREQLVALGPLFTKLGQFASSRKDIMSDDICDELALLQDHQNPFAMDGDYASLAERFECSEPIACASVAQVFVGKMGKKRVAIKVRRPDVVERFNSDLHNIRAVASMARRLNIPGSGNMLEVVEETTPVVLAEVDFVGEARRMTAFRRSLSDVPGVLVPRCTLLAPHTSSWSTCREQKLMTSHDFELRALTYRSFHIASCPASSSRSSATATFTQIHILETLQ